MKRIPSILLVGAAVLLVGIFIEYEPFLGAWMDVITIYVVPFGAMLGAIMIYWVLGTKKIDAELNVGRKRPLGKFFDFCGKYVYILLAVIVFILGISYHGIG